VSANLPFTLVASYRERSYSLEDVADLRETLSEIGPVELKPQWLPEAGGTWELWLNAKAIVEGLEAAVLYDVLKTLGSHSIRWIRRKRRPGEFEPELSGLESSNERLRVSVQTAEGDMPLEVNAAERVVGMLPAEFPQAVVRERDIRLILIKIPPSGSASTIRWLVGMGSDRPTHEYDPEKRRFTVLPSDSEGAQDA
jgi:hypothetical protein